MRPSSSSSSLIYLLGTHLKIVFNEPLSNSPVGINVDVDPGFNGLTTPSASSTSSSSSSSVSGIMGLMKGLGLRAAGTLRRLGVPGLDKKDNRSK